MTSPSNILSAATAQAVELPSLLAVLARLATSDLGRDRILALQPAEDEADLVIRRRRYEEALRLGGGAPLVPDFDVPLGELLVRLNTGRPPLAGLDLVRLADLLRASRAAAQRIAVAAAADPPAPELARLAAGLPDLSALLRKIERTFDRRGEVREDASPRLAS